MSTPQRLGEIRDILAKIEMDLHRLIHILADKDGSAPDHWLRRHASPAPSPDE